MKYNLNKINTRFFTQQMGWLSGKAIENCTNDIVVINDEILTKYPYLIELPTC